MKFNQGKWKVLHLGRDNPMQQYRLGSDLLLESNSKEKDLDDMVVKLTMIQQCVPVANGIFKKTIVSVLKEVILLLYSTLARPCLE